MAHDENNAALVAIIGAGLAGAAWIGGDLVEVAAEFGGSKIMLKRAAEQAREQLAATVDEAVDVVSSIGASPDVPSEVKETLNGFVQQLLERRPSGSAREYREALSWLAKTETVPVWPSTQVKALAGRRVELTLSTVPRGAYLCVIVDPDGVEHESSDYAEHHAVSLTFPNQFPTGPLDRDVKPGVYGWAWYRILGEVPRTPIDDQGSYRGTFVID